MLAPVSERDDLYRILQVDPAASPLVIQAAYRVLARIFHPDVEGDDEQMKRINHAWAVLGDPRSRAEYDRQRAGRHLGPVAATPAAASAPTAQPGSPRAGTPSTAGARAGAKVEDHAGPARGEPFGPVLRFGRYEGWTLGQVVRVDREWLEWLRNVPAGRGLKAEIDAVLQVRRGPGAVDERRHYEANQAKVHTWAPGAPTKVR
jgi:curved DNA-binding protein CbpA